MALNKIWQDFAGFVSNEILYISKVMNQVDPRDYVLGLSLLLAVFVFLFIIQRNNIKRLSGQQKITNEPHDYYQPAKDMEKTEHDSPDAAAVEQKAPNATLDFEGNLSMVMNLSLQLIGASGGCLLIEDGGKHTVPFISKLGKDEEAVFRMDTDAHSLFVRLLDSENFRAIAKEEENYNKLPVYFSATGIELLILVNVTAEKCRGIAAFWYMERPEIETHRLTSLQIMTERMADLLDIQRKYKEMNDCYVDKLRMMAQAIDNLDPHTLGYSGLMARYSEIIAREMNLDELEIKDIVLAASLSNIGLLAFSGELLFKSGKYTDFEYDAMKLHCEVGANIIEAAIANSRVASLIRHHHERMDGKGYPARLTGEEIPLGARIIAVVQTFLAGINGRRYREPLPFEKALRLLTAASNTELDPAVVNALIGWFQKKQANPARKGRSLGACWEMRCAPVDLCKQCPAFKAREQNCWEIEGTNCGAHGNSCPSCFVYTEFLYRMGLKEEKLQA